MVAVSCSVFVSIFYIVVGAILLVVFQKEQAMLDPSGDAGNSSTLVPNANNNLLVTSDEVNNQGSSEPPLFPFSDEKEAQRSFIFFLVVANGWRIAMGCLLLLSICTASSFLFNIFIYFTEGMVIAEALTIPLFICLWEVPLDATKGMITEACIIGAQFVLSCCFFRCLKSDWRPHESRIIRAVTFTKTRLETGYF